MKEEIPKVIFEWIWNNFPKGYYPSFRSANKSDGYYNLNFNVTATDYIRPRTREYCSNDIDLRIEFLGIIHMNFIDAKISGPTYFEMDVEVKNRIERIMKMIEQKIGSEVTVNGKPM